MTLTLRKSRIKLSKGQLFWREIGQGQAVVFLHGTLTDGKEWIPTIEHIKNQFHCFVPDLLGMGDSGKPKCSYSIQLEVDCLEEYFHSLRIHQFYLVGHGLGAWVAASYVLRHPQHVMGLILITPEGVKPVGCSNPWQAGKWLITCPSLLVGILKIIYPIMRMLGSVKEIPKWLVLRKKLRRLPVAKQLLCQRKWREIAGELLQERLGELVVPTLVLVNPLDEPNNVAMAQLYAELIPEAEIKELSFPDPNLLSQESSGIKNHILDFLTGKGLGTEYIPVLQICPHSPTPSPKMNEGELD